MEPTEIYRQTTRHFLAPVIDLLDDPSVSEVLVNGPDHVYFERAGRLHRADRSFADSSSLLAAIRNIAEFVDRQIDGDHPAMDARLPDGSRVNALLPPASRNGACLSIRKYLREHLTLPGLIDVGSLTPAAAELLDLAVKVHRNIVISGGTATGKTSLLNALSSSIPVDERILVIEDSSELQLAQPHTLYLEAQPRRLDGRGEVSVRDLFVNALRMRPDRILVGEVRRGEALDMIQAMLSGHAGALTTVHASTPRDALLRLELLCMMSDVSLPVYVSRAQVASAVQLVVQLQRAADGRRRVASICEVVGLDGDQQYRFRPLFELVRVESGPDAAPRLELQTTGQEPTFAHEAALLGVDRRFEENFGLA